MRPGHIEPCALVEGTLGEDCRIWHGAHIREGAVVGDGTSIGRGAYIDTNVSIGRNCKVQNYACIYSGATIGNDVFIGPHVCFTNDREPRAVGPWEPQPTIVQPGVSIGANATILCGIIIGAHAMIGAGSVVTRSVPKYAKVVGNPGHVVGFVCHCGRPLIRSVALEDAGFCFRCNATVREVSWELLHPSL